MQGLAERMKGRHRSRLNAGLVTGLLIAAAVSTLPMCDACDAAALDSAFSGAGLSSGGGASALGACVFWLAVGIAIVVAVVKLFAHRPGGLVPVLIGIGVAAVLVYSSSADLARTRSSAVDTWQTCFDDQYGPTMGPNPRDSFDGPHQAFDGAPCIEPSEHREAHRRDHPSGDVADGIHQILYRFSDDRARVIDLPIAFLLGLLVALVLVLVLVAMVRRPPPPDDGFPP